MDAFQHPIAIDALRRTGEHLLNAGSGAAGVRLVLAGGVAGMLGGDLDPSRVTADCDVLEANPGDQWPAVKAAAEQTAAELGLPANWLNTECQHYAWVLPLGWRERCEAVGCFGKLQVLRVSRLDLICLKVFGAPKRPQDLQDLATIDPTAEELARARANLDRLEAECLDAGELQKQRRVLDQLESEDV